MCQYKTPWQTLKSTGRFLVVPAILLMSVGWLHAADVGPAAYVPATTSLQLQQQWAGSETLCNYGSLTFQLYSGGRVVMFDAQATTDGVWQQNGQQIAMWFSGGRVYYSGIVNGNVMSGTAQNGNTYWSWNAVSVALSPPVERPTVWAGSENLCNYGQLTFQFYDGGRVVMLDRQSINQGTYRQYGQQITLQFDCGRVLYTGTMAANAMSGTALNGRAYWNWNVNRLVS